MSLWLDFSGEVNGMFQLLTVALLALAASAAFIGADRVIEALQTDGEDTAATPTQTASPVEPNAEEEDPSSPVLSFLNRFFENETNGSDGIADGGEAGSVTNAAIASPTASSAAVNTPLDPQSTQAALSGPETFDPAAMGLYGPPDPTSPEAIPMMNTPEPDLAGQLPETAEPDPPIATAEATVTPTPVAPTSVTAAEPESPTPSAAPSDPEPDVPIRALW
ncbi:MAG: hypothetical protein ACO4AI_12275 [Prochlorothrix sp.]